MLPGQYSATSSQIRGVGECLHGKDYWMNKAKEKKPTEPMTMVAFAEAKKPFIEGLALHIEQADEETLTQEIQHWCENLEIQDADLSKTHAGVYGLLARNAKGKAFAQLWMNSVLKVVLRPPIPENAIGHTSQLWFLMDRLKERNGEDRNPIGMRTVKGRHVLALALLNYSEAHDPHPLSLRDVVKAFNRPDIKLPARKVDPSELIRELFAPKPPDLDLSLVCSIVAPWEAEIENSKPERQRLEAEVASLERRIRLLEERISEARAETADVREELASSRSETAERETTIANLHGEITRIIHDNDRFKGAVNQLLARNLLHPLKTALDATNAQNPGIATINALLNNAIEDIEAFR